MQTESGNSQVEQRARTVIGLALLARRGKGERRPHLREAWIAVRAQHVEPVHGAAEEEEGEHLAAARALVHRGQRAPGEPRQDAGAEAGRHHRPALQQDAARERTGTGAFSTS